MYEYRKSNNVVHVGRRKTTNVHNLKNENLLLFTWQFLSPLRFQCFFIFLVSADGTKLANGLIFGFSAKIFCVKFNFKDLN